MEEHYPQTLIEKYIKGTASEAEREELLSWYRRYNDKNEFLWPYQNIEEENEAKERLLDILNQKIHSPNKKKFQPKSLYYRIAAIAAVLIIVFFLAIKLGSRHIGGSPDYNYVSTKPGEHKTIKLNDGSTVWLSAKSSVYFPKVFSATREISLEGEAFFDVAKDKKHPFIVHTGKLSTKVLGTSFNIEAFKEHSHVVVALITGKVAFSDGHSQVNLSPNHQVIYNKADGTSNTIIIPDVLAIMGRHIGYYEYKNVSVAEIIEDLNRNFNMKIQIEGNVKNCLFYGRIKPNESPQSFLQKMAIVVNATVINLKNGYLIKGGGCI